VSSRIKTTHTGSLPRPSDLLEALQARERGEVVDGLNEQVQRAVSDVVAQQRDAGLDVVNDGELSKIGYSTYVTDRLTGFDGESVSGSPARDLAEHPDFVSRLSGGVVARPTCTGPVAIKDPKAVLQDIANLKAAAAPDQQLFMSAASPGVIAHWLLNRYYGSNEEYLTALADAMRYEYETIVDAGIVLQIDCPDFAMARHSAYSDLSLDEFRRELALHVEVLNHAVQNIEPAQMRIHLCWGNYEGPHHCDVDLADIIDLVLLARPAGIALEAANPRHGHEHRVFDEVHLPEDKYIVAGVIDSTSNYIEHPMLVADRIENYARRLGADRVMAGTDCGFATFAIRHAVAPSIVWAKLKAMCEGAEIAERRL
jgi:5-methyltetrahydropteroyltriglutamate--homocysteine methyltransferase